MTHKQAVLKLLSDRKPHSHHELYELGCVAHSRISDLRRDGYRIDQWREDGLYLYQLKAVALDEPSDPAGELDADSGPVSLIGGSSSVPATVPPLTEPSTSTVASPPVEEAAGTLQLFPPPGELHPLRGAYGDAA